MKLKRTTINSKWNQMASKQKTKMKNNVKNDDDDDDDDDPNFIY